MGLIKAILGAGGSTLGDQWKEYFYCEAMSDDILMVKGEHRTSKRSSNTKGSDNVISNGSIVAVADGQCALIVEQGKIVEFCAESGEFVWDTSKEPTLFSGSLGESLKQTFATIGKRFTFGGETPMDQRVYYINTKQIQGNKFGTSSPVPFRVVDANIGLDIDISVRCNGEYVFKITDPLLFYTNVAANVSDEYEKSNLQDIMKAELLTALQPAFSKISEMGIRYSYVPGHASELCTLLQQELSEKWTKVRGMSIVTIAVNSITASEEDEERIKKLQEKAVYGNVRMAAANLNDAQAEAMKLAAANESTGPMMAFAGMNMAMNAGGQNGNQLFQMDQQNQMYNQQMMNQMNGQMPNQMNQMNGQMPNQMNQMNGQMPNQMNQMNGQMPNQMNQMNGQMSNQMNQMNQQNANQQAGWFCPKCGFKNDSTSMFCPQCGTKNPLQ